MFKLRLITTLILVPLVILGIYCAPLWFVRAIIIFLVIAGGWEWLKLIPISNLLNKCMFILILLVSTYLSGSWFYSWLMLGIGVWFLILLAVLTFPETQKIWGYPLVVAFLCLLMLPLFASSFISVYQLPHGKDLVVYLLFLVWAADVGAYLCGKKWGHHKLIYKVSPGKTWEGSAGGFMLAMLVAFIGYLYFTPDSSMAWFVIAIFVALVSIVGDLFISILKRRCNLKDTGQIFPGHGGVLDRLDSLIAALPFFYFGLYALLPGL